MAEHDGVMRQLGQLTLGSTDTGTGVGQQRHSSGTPSHATRAANDAAAQPQVSHQLHRAQDAAVSASAGYSGASTVGTGTMPTTASVAVAQVPSMSATFGLPPPPISAPAVDAGAAPPTTGSGLAWTTPTSVVSQPSWRLPSDGDAGGLAVRSAAGLSATAPAAFGSGDLWAPVGTGSPLTPTLGHRVSPGAMDAAGDAVADGVAVVGSSWPHTSLATVPPAAVAVAATPAHDLASTQHPWPLGTFRSEGPGAASVAGGSQDMSAPPVPHHGFGAAIGGVPLVPPHHTLAAHDAASQQQQPHHHQPHQPQSHAPPVASGGLAATTGAAVSGPMPVGMPQVSAPPRRPPAVVVPVSSTGPTKPGPGTPSPGCGTKSATPSSGGSGDGEAPKKQKFNLIVNYLGDMSSSQLRALCSRHANVLRCRVVVDNRTGRTRGFAFVRVTSAEEAERVISNLNGYRHNHGGVPKRLKVAHATPRSKSRRGGNVFVSNLQPWVTSEHLLWVSQTYGTVLDCKVLTDSRGASKGIGFVRFSFRREAEAAIGTLNNQRVIMQDSATGNELCLSLSLSMNMADPDNNESRRNRGGSASPSPRSTDSGGRRGRRRGGGGGGGGGSRQPSSSPTTSGDSPVPDFVPGPRGASAQSYRKAREEGRAGFGGQPQQRRYSPNNGGHTAQRRQAHHHDPSPGRGARGQYLPHRAYEEPLQHHRGPQPSGPPPGPSYGHSQYPKAGHAYGAPQWEQSSAAPLPPHVRGYEQRAIHGSYASAAAAAPAPPRGMYHQHALPGLTWEASPQFAWHEGRGAPPSHASSRPAQASGPMVYTATGVTASLAASAGGRLHEGAWGAAPPPPGLRAGDGVQYSAAHAPYVPPAMHRTVDGGDYGAPMRAAAFPPTPQEQFYGHGQ